MLNKNSPVVISEAKQLATIILFMHSTEMYDSGLRLDVATNYILEGSVLFVASQLEPDTVYR